MSEKIYLVSVVRDYAMYQKCILANPHCQSLSIVTLDNREENLPIPVLYNRFIDSIEEDGWVFSAMRTGCFSRMSGRCLKAWTEAASTGLWEL